MLRSKQRIVLVEHDPASAFEAWERLTEAHRGTVQVDVASSLAETLALLASGPVDAVVLDLNLTDSRGLHTLRQVRKAAAQAAIIVVTDGRDPDLHDQALAAGAEGVYAKSETRSALFNRSVLYVVERNRARVQHARLQVLLETMPYAIVIADSQGDVRFTNPAALALVGQADASLLAHHIDFSAPDGEAVPVKIEQGDLSLACEVQVVSIEWEGQPARLASVRPLLAGAQQVPPAAPSAPDLQVEQATRKKDEILASMSLQIRAQMQGVSGLCEPLGERALEPLQTCYEHTLRRGNPALLSALTKPQVLPQDQPQDQPQVRLMDTLKA